MFRVKNLTRRIFFFFFFKLILINISTFNTQAEAAQKKGIKKKKSQQFGACAFKSGIILITSGTKKVNKKMLAECAISRVILVP